MKHVEVARQALEESDEALLLALTGQFYTHEFVGRHMASAMWKSVADSGDGLPLLNVCDPFAGDGRLVGWLIEEAHSRGHRGAWDVELWDLNAQGLREAQAQLDALANRLGISLTLRVHVGDSFEYFSSAERQFDLVVTNPPWENLKPDSRELGRMDAPARSKYVASLRETDIFLSRVYPISQPKRKFAGWGTNLARVGLELCLHITRPGGTLGIVSPSSLVADDASSRLRWWLLGQAHLLDLAFFPAEARLFGAADVSVATLVARLEPRSHHRPWVTTYRKDLTPMSRRPTSLSAAFLSAWDGSIPISLGGEAVDLLTRFAELPPLSVLEGRKPAQMWAGRELDETRISDVLVGSGEDDGTFVKGRMIGRFRVLEYPQYRVEKRNWSPPRSVGFARVAWRDVSRPSQKRRVHATIIPPRWIAGNSLGVAHFNDGDSRRLQALLGIMSSLPFEFQLRSILATGHITLTSLRRVRIPDICSPSVDKLVEAVASALEGGPEADVEAAAAAAFGLDLDSLMALMAMFPKVGSAERDAVTDAWHRMETP